MTACPLSPRQTEAVKWLAEGKSAYETGIIMGVTCRTAQTHLADAKVIAGVHKNASLVAKAIREGWIK
jgi:DNA-binding CsgD family transcriptional regulator